MNTEKFSEIPPLGRGGDKGQLVKVRAHHWAVCGVQYPLGLTLLLGWSLVSSTVQPYISDTSATGPGIQF